MPVTKIADKAAWENCLKENTYVWLGTAADDMRAERSAAQRSAVFSLFFVFCVPLCVCYACFIFYGLSSQVVVDCYADW
jgi:hypothetical protein